MKEKLTRPNSVLLCVRFRIHHYVAAPLEQAVRIYAKRRYIEMQTAASMAQTTETEGKYVE
jgi:hypothetical protein